MSNTNAQLTVENLFVDSMPGDGELGNFQRQVENASYSLVKPKINAQPELIAYSKELAEELGFEQKFVQSPEFVQYFSGNKLIDNSQPYAMCYGGHQFGNWAGQLGDGRAINLGELRNRQGQRQSLQLKGAGPTPYSRTADGLAVLRSSVREFLCSEAMFHLGVPTTRALSLVGTGEQVMRDMFYDGRAEFEPGAVVCRVAPSFIRFGSFEIHAARQEHDLLKQLADYTIAHYFPELDKNADDIFLQWFVKVSELTATMIVDWMRVGFVHGVMNTDNMSIHGLTIDYGPYGWLDNFDPDWTPNTTDAQGRRYRYANQPGVAQWNLLQLANAIFPLVNDAQSLQNIIEGFSNNYQNQWQQMMAAKIGLQEVDKKTDADLFEQLNAVLKSAEVDMTLFYRRLADFNQHECQETDTDLCHYFSACFYQFDQLSDDVKASFGAWLKAYSNRLKLEQRSGEDRAQSMNKVNPLYVLRNYLAQMAIDKAHEKDYSMINTLLEVIRNPYDEKEQYKPYAEKRPEWARQRAGCSMLSCSS